MPLVILIIAIFLIAAGFNGQFDKLKSLVTSDTVPTASNNGGFGIWILVIVTLGVIGYYDKLTGLTRLFIVLVFAVIFLKSDTGFYSNIVKLFPNLKGTS